MKDLVSLVQTIGPQWSKVAESFPGRSPSACKTHYCRKAPAEYRNQLWTGSEEVTLFSLVSPDLAYRSYLDTSRSPQWHSYLKMSSFASTAMKSIQEALRKVLLRVFCKTPADVFQTRGLQYQHLDAAYQFLYLVWRLFFLTSINPNYQCPCIEESQQRQHLATQAPNIHITSPAPHNQGNLLQPWLYQRLALLTFARASHAISERFRGRYLDDVTSPTKENERLKTDLRSKGKTVELHPGDKGCFSRRNLRVPLTTGLRAQRP